MYTMYIYIYICLYKAMYYSSSTLDPRSISRHCRREGFRLANSHGSWS